MEDLRPKPPNTQYAYWAEEDPGYYVFFDSLEEAVREAPTGDDIFEMAVRNIGPHEVRTSVVKVKKPKKAKGTR